MKATFPLERRHFAPMKGDTFARQSDTFAFEGDTGRAQGDAIPPKATLFAALPLFRVMIVNFAAHLALVSGTALAAEDLSPAQAEQRLRACLQASSSHAPRSGLQQAVIAVRAECGAQINRVRADRVGTATATLTGGNARQAERRAIRALDFEVAAAISNFTGLTYDNAENR